MSAAFGMALPAVSMPSSVRASTDSIASPSYASSGKEANISGKSETPVSGACPESSNTANEAPGAAPSCRPVYASYAAAARAAPGGKGRRRGGGQFLQEASKDQPAGLLSEAPSSLRANEQYSDPSVAKSATGSSPCADRSTTSLQHVNGAASPAAGKVTEQVASLGITDNQSRIEGVRRGGGAGREGPDAETGTLGKPRGSVCSAPDGHSGTRDGLHQSVGSLDKAGGGVDCAPTGAGENAAHTPDSSIFTAESAEGKDGRAAVSPSDCAHVVPHAAGETGDVCLKGVTSSQIRPKAWPTATASSSGPGWDRPPLSSSGKETLSSPSRARPVLESGSGGLMEAEKNIRKDAGCDVGRAAVLPASSEHEVENGGQDISCISLKTAGRTHSEFETERTKRLSDSCNVVSVPPAAGTLSRSSCGEGIGTGPSVGEATVSVLETNASLGGSEQEGGSPATVESAVGRGGGVRSLLEGLGRGTMSKKVVVLRRGEGKGRHGGLGDVRGNGHSKKLGGEGDEKSRSDEGSVTPVPQGKSLEEREREVGARELLTCPCMPPT